MRSVDRESSDPKTTQNGSGREALLEAGSIGDAGDAGVALEPVPDADTLTATDALLLYCRLL